MVEIEYRLLAFFEYLDSLNNNNNKSNNGSRLDSVVGPSRVVPSPLSVISSSQSFFASCEVEFIYSNKENISRHTSSHLFPSSSFFRFFSSLFYILKRGICERSFPLSPDIILNYIQHNFLEFLIVFRNSDPLFPPALSRS